MNHLYDTLFDYDAHSRTDDNGDIAFKIINHLHRYTDPNVMSNYFDIGAYNNLIPRTTNSIDVLHIYCRFLAKNI